MNKKTKESKKETVTSPTKERNFTQALLEIHRSKNPLNTNSDFIKRLKEDQKNYSNEEEFTVMAVVGE